MFDPQLADMLDSQVSGFGNSAVIGEPGFILCKLSQVAVYVFDHVGGVNKLSDFHWVTPKGNEVIPVAFP